METPDDLHDRHVETLVPVTGRGEGEERERKDGEGRGRGEWEERGVN
jgi:hypothetical protein